jgi:hypothetical protein
MFLGTYILRATLVCVKKAPDAEAAGGLWVLWRDGYPGIATLFGPKQ